MSGVLTVLPPIRLRGVDIDNFFLPSTSDVSSSDINGLQTYCIIQFLKIYLKIILRRPFISKSRHIDTKIIKLSKVMHLQVYD